MKKKLLAVLLCMAMVAATLIGCGSDGQGGSDELSVGVFYYQFNDTYLTSVREALDAEFQKAGISAQNFDAQNNPATQIEQIDTAIQKGVNLLVVNVVTSGNTDYSQQIVDKAKDADIPVIFFNRAVEDDKTEGKVLGSYDKCAFVGTDAPEAGHLQGKMIGEYLVANYETVDLNGDGTISYAMFMGEQGNAEAIYRTQFGQEDADAVLTDAGKPALAYFDAAATDKFQVDMEGAWSAKAASEYMTTNFVQYNETNNNMIELVICNNDGMAEGVVEVLNANGYNLGDGGKTIPVFGVDATENAKALIAAGKMTGTVKQDAEGMAAQICDLTENVSAGKELLDGVAADRIAETVANKIYIPYATYTGE